jgi:hypothetical protein
VAIKQLSPPEEIAYSQQATERGLLGDWWRRNQPPPRLV